MGPAAGDNARSMKAICRLLALVSVLLMPFGMTAAAEASSPSHHETAGMMMGHCPDQPQPDSKPGIAACTMVCSAALPAIEPAQPHREAVDSVPAETAEIRRLAGLHPDAAIPPPKRA